jgi:ATP-dependent RNA helicase DeaD
MPKQVERIARRYLKDPAEISIKAKTATAETIRQRYWQVSGVHKLDALTRMLEVEPFDAILMFVRTKTATSELAEKLEARGYAAAAMNGDMPQAQREQTVDRLKRGVLDILVATDVAARGLDVDRISHVINYDIPYDTEAYIHRIGRTGRAGRRGDAILFVAPRERRMLAAIEKATRQKVEQMYLPSTETVNNKRIADFKQKITDTLAGGEIAFMQSLVEQYRQEHDVPAIEIAAGLAKMFIGDKAMLLDPDKGKPVRSRDGHGHDKQGTDKRGKREHGQRPPRDAESGTERFRIEVGHVHGVKPGNIVGAIANEAGLAGEHIGHIQIEEDHSFVDLPEGMPKEIFRDLQNVRVCGRQIRLSRLGESRDHAGGADIHQATSKNRDKPAGRSKGKPKGKSKGKSFGKPAFKAKGKPSGKPATREKGKPAAAGKGKPVSQKKKSPKKRLKKPAAQ